MAEDLGLFPPAATGRYSARRGSEPWTELDRLLLYPVLARCGSEYSYLRTCSWLCSILGRDPVFPETQRPTRTEQLEAAVKIIERKTVTENLLVSGCLAHLARPLNTWRRTGLPFSYFEVRLVRAFHNKRVLAGPPGREGRLKTISEHQLLDYLDRRHEDQPSLRAMLAQLEKSQRLDDAPEDRAADPSSLANGLKVAGAVQRVRSAAPENLQREWAGLADVLDGVPSSTLG